MTREEARQVFQASMPVADVWRVAFIEATRDAVSHHKPRYIWTKNELRDDGDEAMYFMQIFLSDSKTSLHGGFSLKTIRVSELTQPYEQDPIYKTYRRTANSPWVVRFISKESFLRRVVLWLRKEKFTFSTLEFKALFDVYTLRGANG